MFFFFKQKTAYEMLISDWSSDVCSSDRAKYGDTTKWYTVNYEALKELGFTLSFESSSSVQGIGSEALQNQSSALNENVPLNQYKKGSVSLTHKRKTSTRVSQSNIPLNKINKIINNLSPTEVGSDYKKMILILNEIEIGRAHV